MRMGTKQKDSPSWIRRGLGVVSISSQMLCGSNYHPLPPPKIGGGRGIQRCVAIFVFLLCLIVPYLYAQVSYDRLLRAAAEPQNWLTYSGGYASQRYSSLGQVTPANV